ncbi:hypothetical protein CLV37_10810 [Kineococcus rhizosphaerae]|uniref:Uncharacterized protein n=1 Tax=Kineococcus rhizosphaerae TaxID=559628 RepID=A0A2T0R1B8_9ACTN|nr:hypothetical protein CLV37_10810 [Kineococcus rhizosphaerae]
MSALVVLCVLLALALTAPWWGADTRWPGSATRPDRSERGKRYRKTWDAAIAGKAHQDDFGRAG